MNSLRVRTGLFLALSLGVLAVTIALLGRSQNLFSRKVELYTSFTNVSGLVIGSPVRLAGVDVGMVRKIEFFLDKDRQEKKVRVVLAVESSALEHVRKDSVAQLSSKGLLGDMLVNLTIGSNDEPPLAPGDFINPQEAAGLSQVIESVEVAIANIKTLTIDVNKSLKEVLTPDLGKDIGRIMRSTANLTERIERGDGLLHALIYDQQMTNEARAVLGDARGAVTKVRESVAHIEAILAEAERGDGMLHALIYEKGGGKTMRELERVARELGNAAEEIRTGNGMIHSLIYEKDRSNLIQDLAAAARIVKNVAEEVNQGKGTLGGLLKDPTVYQDLKTVLGNIKRNILLKSIIRLTIEKDDLKRTGDVKED